MAHLDSPRVLIIDDDRLFLEIASKNLERADFKVEVSDDPREGARRAIDEEFDLILLDLRLPEMSGEEVLGLLKSLSIQRPVAIVTAEGSEAYRERARDLGAAAYIQKPVDAENLRQVVDGLVQGSRRERAASEDRPPRGVTGRLVLWVFGHGEVTVLKRLAAVGVAAGLCAVLAWLILG